MNIAVGLSLYLDASKLPTGTQQPQDGPAEDGDLYCRRCGTLVTWKSAHRPQDGGYSRTFVNPLGQAFEVACFTRTCNLTTVGSPVYDHSWFPQFAWQIVAAPNAAATSVGVIRLTPTSFGASSPTS